MQRPVEAEARADLLDVPGAGVVARDDRGGVARREAQQAEDDQRHHPHDGDGGRQPPDEEREAAPLDYSTETFQYKLAGKVSTPFTFLRYAVGCVNWPHGTYGTSS